MTNARAGKKVGRESGRAADFQWGKIIGVKCRRILTLMASIVLISISVAGCGQESDRSAVERPGKSTEWTAETVDLPPYLSVSGETSFGDDFYYIGYTGTESAFEAKIYRMDMGEAAPVPVELPYRSDQDLDREEYLDLAIDAEGNLVLLTGQSAVNGGDPAITDVTWKRIDQEGGVVATGSVMEYFADTAYPVPTGMAIDGAGNLYFYQGKILVVVDKAGALLMETTVENDITSIFTDQSGAVNLLAFNVNINTMEVYTIDPVAGAAELSYSLPQGEVYFDVVGNDDGNLVLISDRGVYDFLVDTQAINTRLEWSSINISTDYMGRFLPLSDGRM
ncbi:MAG: hypothetical protein LBV33_04130, partial [Lachnospiraceae bacterium]|nr:hypothetical protein [Lachnospiraceae bacterium]